MPCAITQSTRVPSSKNTITSSEIDMTNLEECSFTACDTPRTQQPTASWDDTVRQTHPWRGRVHTVSQRVVI
eukprot:m.329297 g.329297  ORF g.329297 m.329297 type:complete len:72 (+) comp16505_c0_seq1:1036-1251(+)